MTFPATAVIVLIASPGDTGGERLAVAEALGKWNVQRGEKERVVVIPWLYEHHAIPILGGGAQSVINAQALARADIVVAFFDARLGTETADAVSGTAEEIQKASEAGKPVHVYFSSEDIARDHLDVAQLGALQKFRARLTSEGLLGQYVSPADLAGQVHSAIDHDVTVLSLVPGADSFSPSGARWELRHSAGDAYVVENVGDSAALQASVGPNKDLMFIRTPGPEDVPPGEAIEFVALMYGTTEDRRVLLSWTDEQSGEPRSWKYPLPHRPRR